MTCAGRKRAVAPPALRLRTHRDETIEGRANSWRRALRAEPAQEFPAADLYSGGYWSVVSALADVTGEEALWIASAGYGLLQPDSSVKPYEATFTRGHVDSVFRTGDSASPASWQERWWRLVTRTRERVPREQHPTCIADLATQDPETALVVVASEAYVLALRADLERSRAQLADPDLLVIISATRGVVPSLQQNIVVTDARLQAELGGARQTLNVRVAQWLFATKNGARFTATAGRRHVSELLARQPALVTYDRRRLTDDEVREFIRTSSPGQTSRTRLLRLLRDSGKACEQGRFGRLFTEVAGEQ